MMSASPSPDAAATAPRRNVAYARVWTAQRAPILPGDLADALYGRGFMPGFTDPEGTSAAVSEAGLADIRFEPGGVGYRIVSLTSARGRGCRVTVDEATETDLPDDYQARRAVSRPRLVYTLDAGGPSNSDRNLCENIAEALLLMTSGVVLIGGLGTKGNKPHLHTSSWVGTIKAIT
jgi:hypothetical protein